MIVTDLPETLAAALHLQTNPAMDIINPTDTPDSPDTLTSNQTGSPALACCPRSPPPHQLQSSLSLMLDDFCSGTTTCSNQHCTHCDPCDSCQSCDPCDHGSSNDCTICHHTSNTSHANDLSLDAVVAAAALIAGEPSSVLSLSPKAQLQPISRPSSRCGESASKCIAQNKSCSNGHAACNPCCADLYCKYCDHTLAGNHIPLATNQPDSSAVFKCADCQSIGTCFFDTCNNATSVQQPKTNDIIQMLPANTTSNFLHPQSKNTNPQFYTLLSSVDDIQRMSQPRFSASRGEVSKRIKISPSVNRYQQSCTQPHSQLYKNWHTPHNRPPTSYCPVQYRPIVQYNKYMSPSLPVNKADTCGSGTSSSSISSSDSSSAFSSRSNSIASTSSTVPWNNSTAVAASAQGNPEYGDTNRNPTVFYNEFNTHEPEFDTHLLSIHMDLDKNESKIKVPIGHQHQAFQPGPKRGYDEYAHDTEHNDVKSLLCNWDDCTEELAELDGLLEHLKKDHHIGHLHNNNFQQAAGKTLAQNVVQQHTPPESNTNTPVSSETNVQTHWGENTFNASNNMGIHTQHPNNALDSHKADEVSYFQCEWKDCRYQCTELDKFMMHVRQDHVMNMLIDSTKQAKTESAPQIPEYSGIEAHTCRWELLQDGNHNSNGECGLVFESTQGLNQHVIDEHIGLRKNSYTCLWAGCERNKRPFAQRQKMHRHLITHTKHKPFVCEHCGNSFSESLVLKQHMRVHSGEKPFGCKVCGKRFAASTAVSVHMRTHTGEKPLACKWVGCEKRFSESSNLAKHMKTHQVEKPYMCPVQVCGRKFVRHDQLQRHMKTHEQKPNKN